ncbi:MAG: TIGR03905 family TSCPD domain-containing protein [Spirochaetaceae bacterium]|jgi:uncharacterized protein (TIGR03905 family)|nr:TIGR03905 family TSCPD domain-containing protein [Spirochaetaceae bacterium]
MFEYKTRGTCSSRIRFDVRDGLVHDVQFDGGCAGNLAGIPKLIEGMKAVDVIGKLKGTPCGNRPTSCPDQLAIALEEALKAQSKT